MKRMVCGLIISLLLFTNISFANTTPANWAEDAYYHLFYQEVLGDDLGNISLLNQQITREEFAELTVRVYAKSKGIAIETIGKKPAFVDTSNPFVERAHYLGIVNGVDATHFQPTSNVKREEIATMLTRMMKILGVDTRVVGDPNISDVNEISSWARDAMFFCRLNAILNGIGKDSNGKTIVAPKNLATRQESIVLSYNLMKKYDWVKSYETTNPTTLNNRVVYDDVADALESFSQSNSVGLISNPVAAFKAPPNIEKHHYLIYETAIANGVDYEAAIILINKINDLYDNTRKVYLPYDGYLNAVSGQLRSTEYTGKQVKIHSDGILILEFIN